MKKKIIGLMAVMLTTLSFMLMAAPASASIAPAYKPEVNLKQEMRKLWEDHINWTRMAVLSIVDKVPGSDQTVARLLQNPTDLANVIKQFYGDKAANDFATLMSSHLTIAADFVTAAAAGDSTKAADLEKQWYVNANAIAVFMGKANPKYWPTSVVKMMLYDHLRWTKAEAVARITKDYSADVAAYDTIHNQALMMADAMSDGIAAQFPAKIKKFVPTPVAMIKEPTVQIAHSATLGDYLTATNGFTLYTFKNDKPNDSYCTSGKCAMNWLPLTTNGTPMAGTGVTGVLKVVKMDKGIKQVTYNGSPLYYWIGDQAPGDTTGEGVANLWNVAKP